jgi:hypothetical protein
MLLHNGTISGGFPLNNPLRRVDYSGPPNTSRKHHFIAQMQSHKLHRSPNPRHQIVNAFDVAGKNAAVDKGRITGGCKRNSPRFSPGFVPRLLQSELSWRLGIL